MFLEVRMFSFHMVYVGRSILIRILSHVIILMQLVK
jgi:hypothetical protein